MDGEPNVSIIAVITTNKEKVSGGVPIFLCADQTELQDVSLKLENILDAAAHEINQDTMILVKH